MTDRLQALSDAGVSIWLDDLSRERIETGNLAELAKDKHVVGVTTNPTIFADALADGERYDDQVRRARRRRRRRVAGDLRADHRRRPQRLRHHAALLRRRPEGRPRLHRGRPRAWPTTPTATSTPPRTSGPPSTGPTCFIKIPRHRRGPPRHPPGDRRGHQRQRHPDLQPRALPRGHGRLPRRPGGRPERRSSTSATIHSVASFFVSRVDTEVDKRLDAIGTDEADGAERPGRRRQRPPRLRGVRGGLRRRPLRRPSGLPGPTRSGRCGPPPA